MGTLVRVVGVKLEVRIFDIYQIANILCYIMKPYRNIYSSGSCRRMRQEMSTLLDYVNTVCG